MRINFNKNDKKIIGENKICMYVDFHYNNKIIEFDGTYWHKNNLDDIKKNIILKSKNYEILRIKEKDFDNNFDKVLKRCLKYLNLL